MKEQLEQEIGKRQLCLAHTSRDVDELSEIPSRLNNLSEIPSRLNTMSMNAVPLKPDIDALLLDQQAKKIVDDLFEPQLNGRAVSPIRVAFTRSRSPFRGHRALPHYPVPLRSATRK